MYVIKRVENNINYMDDKVWGIAETANVDKNNWSGFETAPKTTGKLVYNDYGIYVRLETDEKPLLARFCNQNDKVCCDSCMEFFLRTEDDERYLNFEFNPFGTMCLAFRKRGDKPYFPENDKKYFNVTSYVDDESWVLRFCIHFEFIDKLYGAHTKTIYGNIYKCGEHLEKKHYASYYPIGTEKPNFHCPEFFGKFVFED